MQPSTYRAICRSSHLPIQDLQIHLPTDPAIYKTIDLPIQRSRDQAKYRFSDLQIGPFTDLPIYRSIDLLIQRTTDRAIYRSSDQ